MKITAIRPFLKQLALTTPYTIAYETCTDATLVFLEIELQNGMIGLGSASPSEEVVGENPHQTLLHLQSDFLQQFVGRDIRHFQQLIFETCQHFPRLWLHQKEGLCHSQIYPVMQYCQSSPWFVSSMFAFVLAMQSCCRLHAA